MKTLILAAALSLAACATPGEMRPQTAAKAKLDTLKEANRHIETCERTYGWPFYFNIHCVPQPAADLDARIAKAVKDYLDRFTASVAAARAEGQ